MSGFANTRGLSAEVRRRTGINVARCYQCGKCSAGCPMAAETTLRPHDLLRLAQRGDADAIFEDDSIWLCVTCESCSARCPNDVDPARVVDALRELALDAGHEPPRAIRAFHDAFLAEVRRHGRMGEVGLTLGYKLRSGALLDDVAAAPALLARGKLRFARPHVDGLAEVQRIFARCEREDA